jgi:CDGSH-type Zn-finger protein
MMPTHRPLPPGMPGVFDPRQRPWIALDGHTADEIAEFVERCPTGALRYSRLDGGLEESAPAGTTIVEAVPDGPLYVRRRVVVGDKVGGVFREDTRMALCRRGQSRHRPFCDNTHRLIGFRNRTSPSTAGG